MMFATEELSVALVCLDRTLAMALLTLVVATSSASLPRTAPNFLAGFMSSPQRMMFATCKIAGLFGNFSSARSICTCALFLESRIPASAVSLAICSTCSGMPAISWTISSDVLFVEAFVMTKLSIFVSTISLTSATVLCREVSTMFGISLICSTARRVAALSSWLVLMVSQSCCTVSCRRVTTATVFSCKASSNCCGSSSTTASARPIFRFFCAVVIRFFCAVVWYVALWEVKPQLADAAFSHSPPPRRESASLVELFLANMPL
mmetsp:Transcript_18619/g.32595  ORF Transcript_18619/g.32595 Transcript_18619/m.32595 type:complete len:264 (+) Transcript_18619:956-1747(+)